MVRDTISRASAVFRQNNNSPGTKAQLSTIIQCVLLETWLSGRKRLRAKELGWKHPRRFESCRLRQNSESEETDKAGSRRRRDTNAFPPPNPESKRVFHAPRGSKSTVRSLI